MNSRNFWALICASIICGGVLSMEPSTAQSGTIQGPADGLMLLGSTKNNYVKAQNGVVYLTSGTLLAMVKAPATQLTVATSLGVVQLPREAQAFVSLNGDQLVVNNLSQTTPVTVSLPQKRFPYLQQRLSTVAPQQQFSAVGVPAAGATQPTITIAPPPGRQASAQSALVQNAPQVEAGSATVGMMTGGALAAVGGVLNLVAANKTLPPWQYAYMNSFKQTPYLQPYIAAPTWFSPPGMSNAVLVPAAQAKMPVQLPGVNPAIAPAPAPTPAPGSAPNGTPAGLDALDPSNSPFGTAGCDISDVEQLSAAAAAAQLAEQNPGAAGTNAPQEEVPFMDFFGEQPADPAAPPVPENPSAITQPASQEQVPPDMNVWTPVPGSPAVAPPTPEPSIPEVTPTPEPAPDSGPTPSDITPPDQGPE